MDNPAIDPTCLSSSLLYASLLLSSCIYVMCSAIIRVLTGCRNENKHADVVETLVLYSSTWLYLSMSLSILFICLYVPICSPSICLQSIYSVFLLYFSSQSMKQEDSLPPEAQRVVAVPDVVEVAALPGDLLLLACDGESSVPLFTLSLFFIPLPPFCSTIMVHLWHSCPRSSPFL